MTLEGTASVREAGELGEAGVAVGAGHEVDAVLVGLSVGLAGAEVGPLHGAPRALPLEEAAAGGPGCVPLALRARPPHVEPLRLVGCNTRGNSTNLRSGGSASGWLQHPG